ncbi:MAG: 4-hydroxybutyryl-CoA dehydratase [Deltaproteobacteria bacterium]|nr:4-hydroxybutyryl-CoA dehydratase [Deltaproteobacteria bacterium]
MRSKDEYLESIHTLDHLVFIQGKPVNSIVENPLSRPSSMAMAETFYQAQFGENQNLFTCRSHITGERINRFAHIQHTTEDLIKKIDMLRIMGRKTACCFQRCAGLDCMNTMYAITYDIDEKHGTNYHERFKQFLKEIHEKDMVPAACMTDAKGDRSLSPSQQEDRDQYLHIEKETKDGIIVRGAKLHITGGVNSHELIVLPTRSLREEDKDYSVAFAIPADTDGITFIYGRQPSDGRRQEETRPDIGNLYFGGSEALVVFEDVFVPEDRIFMKGEFNFTGPMIELFASHHRASYGGCKVGVGDVLIGATAAIAEFQGTEKASHIQDKIAEMIHLNETLYAGAIASSVKGYPTQSNAYAVNRLLANTCKLNVTRFPYEICRLAQDVAGGLLVTMPSVADLENAEIGQYCRKYFTGKKGVESGRRLRILRLIENMTLGTGAAAYLTESLHGAGSPQAQKIMIARLADIESVKKCAFRLCGIEDLY